MTSVLLDDYYLPSQGSIPQKSLNSEKNVGGQKNRSLRLDSPTTLQACQELGLLQSDLKPKSLADFKDSLVDEDVIQLRYQFYRKKYAQMITDVWTRKRQINKKLKDQRLQELERTHGAESSTLNLAASAESSPNVLKTPGNYFQSVNKSFLPLSNLMQYPQSTKMFRKTLSNFNDTQETNEIFSRTQGAFEGLDKTYADEFMRFSRAKMQKQKEAHFRYEEELKKLKMIESFKEKEKKREEFEKAQNGERKRKELERKRTQSERNEKIRQSEKEFKSQQMEAKKGIQARYEKEKNRYEDEVEKTKKIIAERRDRMDRKHVSAMAKRREFLSEEIKMADNLKVSIDAKIAVTNSRHRMNLNEMASKMKERILKVEDHVEKNKEQKYQEEADDMNEFIQSLVKKEENLQIFNKRYMKALREKEAERKYKHERHLSNQNSVDNKQLKRVQEVDARFRRVQENLKEKKKIDEKNQRLKQELSALHLKEKLEGVVRKERQLEYERTKMFEKEQMEKQKLALLMQKRKLTQQAKAEFSVQLKLEREKIDDSFHHLSKIMSSSSTGFMITNKQKRILKDILRPSDYEKIEEKERVKEAEQEALLEKRERGGQ